MLIYRPLAPCNEFRLLLLWPSEDFNRSIECALYHSTLSACEEDIIEPYTALSYVWGDQARTRNIILEGQIVTVTENLESALRHIRDKHRTLRIWADALCINQANNEEKGHQVNQMGAIYGTAQHTIIYMGELSLNESQIFYDIRAFDVAFGKPKLNMQDLKEVRTMRRNICELFLARTWFDRVWVFQELVLSRDPWVQCGSERIRWNMLCRFDLAISQAEQSLSSSKIDGFIEQSKLQRLNTSRQQYMKFMDIDEETAEANQFWANLLRIMIFQRGLGATDKKDMIYAHVGVAIGPAGRRSNSMFTVIKNFKIDYALSIAEAYTIFARSCMLQGHDVLNLAETIEPSRRQYKLPSWVPDWTAPTLRSWPMTFQEKEIAVLEDGNVLARRAVQISLKQSSQLPTDELLICRTNQIGAIRALGTIMVQHKCTAEEIQAAWAKYFPSLPDLQIEAVDDFYYDLWARENMYEAYLQHIGLVAALRSLRTSKSSIHDKMAVGLKLQDRPFGWNPNAIARNVREETKAQIHPFDFLMLLHMGQIGAQHQLNENHEHRLRLYRGRRFCILDEGSEIFDYETHLGLAPDFAEVGDTVHLIGQQIDRPVTPFLLRADAKNGDVEVQDGTRHVLIGRCFFRRKEIEHARVMKGLFPGRLFLGREMW